MKSRSLVFLLFLFSISTINAQKDKFIPGQIILKDQTVLDGQIKVSYAYNTPQRISFENENGQKKSYAPKELAGFNLGEQRQFRSFFIDAFYPEKISKEEMLALSEKEPNLASVDTLKNEWVFLQLLQKGKVNLYMLDTDKGSQTHFFIQKSEDTNFFYELYKVKYYTGQRTKSGSEIVRTVDLYKQQLETKLEGLTENFRSKIAQLDYEKENIYDFILDYNQSFNPVLDFQLNSIDSIYIKKPKPKFYILAGVGSTQMKVIQANEYVTKAGFEQATALRFGGSLEVELGNFYLINDLILSPVNYTGEHVDNPDSAFPRTIKNKLSILHLRWNLMAGRKILDNNKMQLRADLGFANSINSVTRNSQTIHSEGLVPRNIDREVFYAVRGFHTGLVGGLNLKYNNFSLGAYYEFNISIDGTQNVQPRTLSLIVKYLPKNF